MRCTRGGARDATRRRRMTTTATATAATTTSRHTTSSPAARPEPRRSLHDKDEDAAPPTVTGSVLGPGDGVTLLDNEPPSHDRRHTPPQSTPSSPTLRRPSWHVGAGTDTHLPTPPSSESRTGVKPVAHAPQSSPTYPGQHEHVPEDGEHVP
jgi:hypothetical protein